MTRTRRSRSKQKTLNPDKADDLAPKKSIELAAKWPKDDACPLCGREVMPGPSLNEHHLVPKSLGGREKYVIHKTCHQKIHSVFTEKELEKEYHTFERLLSHPEMNKFVRWVKKQPAESVLRSRWTKERRK